MRFSIGKKRSDQEGDMLEDSMFPNFYKHIEIDYKIYRTNSQN